MREVGSVSRLDELKQAAEELRDANWPSADSLIDDGWTATGAFYVAAFDPSTVLRLVAVAEAGLRLMREWDADDTTPIDAEIAALRGALQEIEA